MSPLLELTFWLPCLFLFPLCSSWAYTSDPSLQAPPPLLALIQAVPSLSHQTQRDLSSPIRD